MEHRSNEEKENHSAVIWLGIVSLFNDLSSEVIGRLLPIYILVVVQSSFLGIGFVEALSDATSILGKLFSGFYSDKIHYRKPLVFAGYLLSVASRPLILLSPTLGGISIARFFDRCGKAIRSPPRDALIADLSNEKNRGLNFGINRGLDTLGAVLGLAAVYFYLPSQSEATPQDLKKIILVAAIVGVIALFSLGFGVKEPRSKKPLESKRFSLSPKDLDTRLKRYLFISALFALASSSDAFIIVRGKGLGLSLKTIMGAMVCFNLVSAVFAVKLAKLSDRFGRKLLLSAGWVIYAVSYFSLGNPKLTETGFFATLVFYGLFYGFTEGVEKALVADFETGNRKGLAYGWLGLVQGLCVIPANLVFAYIYEKNGAPWAFWMSAGLAVCGVLLLLAFKPQPVETA